MKKRIIKNKKGVSHVIEMVLLTALAVGMGAFVTIWYMQSSEKQSTELLGTYENQAECLEVKFDASFDYPNCQIKLYNLGKYRIDQIKIDVYMPNKDTASVTFKESPPFPLLPGTDPAIVSLSNEIKDFEKAKFTPIIIKDKRKLVCPSEKEYTIGEGGPFVNC